MGRGGEGKGGEVLGDGVCHRNCETVDLELPWPKKKREHKRNVFHRIGPLPDRVIDLAFTVVDSGCWTRGTGRGVRWRL